MHIGKCFENIFWRIKTYDQIQPVSPNPLFLLQTYNSCQSSGSIQSRAMDYLWTRTLSVLKAQLDEISGQNNSERHTPKTQWNKDQLKKIHVVTKSISYSSSRYNYSKQELIPGWLNHRGPIVQTAYSKQKQLETDLLVVIRMQTSVRNSCELLAVASLRNCFLNLCNTQYN
ncbi:Hypothetical_protein [Hexamita inflata]|uniref:Hypothetical_protein n=1 Tax=Hexamita inflata TaxID=28002 RepID=A0ABP1H280_9EUKA